MAPRLAAIGEVDNDGTFKMPKTSHKNYDSMLDDLDLRLK